MANETMGLIARKVGMTQLYNDDGTVLPVTVLQAGPCHVVQVKTPEGRLVLGYKRDKTGAWKMFLDMDNNGPA